MKAKIFNTALGTLIMLMMHSICFAKTATGASTILDPLAEIKIVKSPCGNFMLLDAKSKHVHLSGKDIDALGTEPGLPDNSLCYVSASTNQNSLNQQENNDADIQVKNYSKSYPVDANTRLDIDNRYGKVSINTWAKNEFKVDVQIKVIADKTNDTKNLLGSISINDKKQGQTVSFKTNIDKETQPDLFGNKTASRKVEINYVVYMPAHNALNVTNKYGDVVLPDFDGKLVVNCSFGNLQAKSLTNPANQIKVSYGDARIASLRASDLDISFGNLVLGSVDKLNADVKYSSAKIGKISTSGVISVKYGAGLQIDDIDKNMKNLLVNSDYSNVKLGLGNNENADFDVTVHYGSFSYGNHPVNISKKQPAEDKQQWDAAQNFKGHVGKGNVEKLISINSNYSSVKFD